MEDINKLYQEYYVTRGNRLTPLGYATTDILDILKGNYTIERLQEDVENWAKRIDYYKR